MAFVVIVWLVFAVLVGVWASSWERSGVGYFLGSLALSPFVAGIFLLLSGKAGRKCPKCAEMVKMEAKKCKHCGYEFTEQEMVVQEAGSGEY